MMIAGKEWRYGTGFASFRMDTKYKTVISDFIAENKRKNLAANEDDTLRKKSYKGGIVSGVLGLGAPSQAQLRRQSKMVSNPKTPSTADPKSALTNVEKSSTVSVVDSSKPHPGKLSGAQKVVIYKY